ncbi:MAG TPA: pyrroline-5-carboxylate reductase [Defluviitaleaceae bacterium]|jgi:pyrroline-5-carboxylate reductase|nr:pyrroline-5-carboxylate reductase [Candidatus Epulonipiscium sp.]HOQ16155.1 pyrroline-5-carboxylate reductase [Defluviitaleaceae bacterium]HPT76198.1 pyrroline-5-carboxylate reductase [Defluviitaleaceae bacterium]HQD50367.1 pyrroline-5-carboxylate reductase [Defluviitaleaceae bacterium]
MNKIGFIGAGNMGYAMLKGLLSYKNKEDLLFTDKSAERVNWVKNNLNVHAFYSNKELVNSAKYIVMAIKPQDYSFVLEDIKAVFTKEHILISIAPGISIASIKQVLGEDAKIVRAMPNTPALVGAGMSVISFSEDSFTVSERNEIFKIFSSFGEVEEIEEKLMNAVVPISGSSPAYVFMMIEAMADGGVLAGLPRKLSYKLAAQAVMGSAKMFLESQTHPGELKDAVCSPAGTTIEAVAVLEKRAFRSSIIEAMKACLDKANQMKK